MKISEIMQRDVCTIEPGSSLQAAAQRMQAADIGALVVHDGGRLLGVVTDRDIAIRAVARGLSPQATVAEVMSRELCCCRDNADVDEVIGDMMQMEKRRLPVLDSHERLVGIVSLADIAAASSDGQSAELLRGVAHTHNHTRPCAGIPHSCHATTTPHRH